MILLDPPEGITPSPRLTERAEALLSIWMPEVISFRVDGRHTLVPSVIWGVRSLGSCHLFPSPAVIQRCDLLLNDPRLDRETVQRIPLTREEEIAGVRSRLDRASSQLWMHLVVRTESLLGPAATAILPSTTSAYLQVGADSIACVHPDSPRLTDASRAIAVRPWVGPESLFQPTHGENLLTAMPVRSVPASAEVKDLLSAREEGAVTMPWDAEGRHFLDILCRLYAEGLSVALEEAWSVAKEEKI